MGDIDIKKRFTAEQVSGTKCGFCGKSREEVKSLVVGLKPGVAICDECVAVAREIVDIVEIEHNSG